MADPVGQRQQLKPRELIEALERFEVDYVAIGGIAALAHGSQQLTQDFDLMIERSSENCRRAIKALLTVEAEICLSGNRRASLDPNADPGWLAQGEHFFDSAVGGIDIRDPKRVPGSRSYDDLRADALQEKLSDGATVWIVSRNDLLAMKRAAGREKDKQVVAELEALDSAQPRHDESPHPTP